MIEELGIQEDWRLIIEERAKQSYKLLKSCQQQLGFHFCISWRQVRVVSVTFNERRNRLTVTAAALKEPNYLAHALGVLFAEVEQ